MLCPNIVMGKDLIVMKILRSVSGSNFESTHNGVKTDIGGLGAIRKKLLYKFKERKGLVHYRTLLLTYLHVFFLFGYF